MAILNYISNINANNNSGDKMKLYVYDKFNKYSNKLADKISKYYDVKLFNISDNTELKDINNIAISNKNWIIEGNNNNYIDIIYNLADTIIFIDIKTFLSKKEIKIDEESTYLIKKHSRKIIILRSKKDVNKYLKSMYKTDIYTKLELE